MSEYQTLQKPLVSVITVCYNAGNTIAATLKSVALQTAVDYEHIIMDGASRDNTLALVRELETPRTKVFSGADHGIYDAMNKALGKASGIYVLFLNSGDTFADSESLQRFIDGATKNIFPDIVYGQTMIVDKDGRILGPRHLTAPAVLELSSFKDGMVVCHQAFMVKKEIAPLYNTDYSYSADYEWCIRCLQLSKSNLYLGERPVIHYLSEGMTTKHHKESLRERYRIMCFYFGTFPTLMRHLRFALRYFKRRKKAFNVQ